jgi:cytochrome bd-type quinol oxidase subunit 2
LRLLQNIAVVVGAICVALVSTFYAFVILIADKGDPETRGYGIYIGGLFCVAPLGVILGVMASILWIRARRHDALWSKFVWLGIAVGLVLGPFLSFSRIGPHDDFGWWATWIVTIASGALGGFMVSVLSALQRPPNLQR